MRYALVVIVAVSAVGVGACKKRRSTAQETPEATVAAFFEAINNKRIPRDLDNFISDPKELHTMRFRCKDRRCRRGQFKIRSVGERTSYSAVLFVDYKVFSHDGGIAIRGRKSPFTLERLGKRWLIKTIGRRLRADSNQPTGNQKPLTTSQDGGAARLSGDAGSR